MIDEVCDTCGGFCSEGQLTGADWWCYEHCHWPHNTPADSQTPPESNRREKAAIHRSDCFRNRRWWPT